jgi:hypothetical protein
MLRSSAVSDEVIRAREYRTVRDPAVLRSLRFSVTPAKRVPGLLVPMYNVDGKLTSYQYRPDKPRKRDGKPVKYETRTGGRNIFDVHPDRQPYLNDPAASIIFTEGVKKADSLSSLGYVTIGLAGVWCWRGRKDEGGTGPLKDFDSVNWQGRNVWIVFDSDGRENENVKGAAEALQNELLRRGANPWVVFPPAGPNGEKVGVDDFIKAGGDFAALCATAFRIEKKAPPEMLERVEAELERLATDPDVEAPANSLLEVLRTSLFNPDEPCRQGITLAGRIGDKYATTHYRCSRGNCPRCVRWYIAENVCRALETLGDPETVQIVRLDSKKDVDRARKRLGKGVRVLQHDGSMNYLPVVPYTYFPLSQPPIELDGSNSPRRRGKPPPEPPPIEEVDAFKGVLECLLHAKADLSIGAELDDLGEPKRVRRITGLTPRPKRDRLEGSRFVCVPRDQDPVRAAEGWGVEGELKLGQPVDPFSRRFGGWLTPEQRDVADDQLDEWEEQSRTRREAWLSRREILKWFPRMFGKATA